MAEQHLGRTGSQLFVGWTIGSRQWPPWLRYTITVLLIAIPLGLQAIWYEAAEYPFLFFLVYVVACATLFDRGSSLLATALSGAVLAFFSLEPQYAFSVPGAPDAIAWLIFMVLALVTGGTIELFHRLTDELRSTLDELHSANAALGSSEREKDLLLRETMHRTRNDLTRLLGLIKLEEHSVDDPRLREKLQHVADRVHVFSRLQNRLSMAKEASVVQMHEFLADLCQDLQLSLAGVRPIRIHTHADPHPVRESTAIALGLITNELVTNALKHAFPGNRAGTINVILRSLQNECMLCVEDDGVGMTERDPPGNKSGQGQTLISSLISQLRGQFDLRRRRDGTGTIASVRFPSA